MSNSTLESEEEDLAGLLERSANTDPSEVSGVLGDDEPPAPTDEIDEFAEQATEKVQLDIEDAMFLAEPEPEVVPEAEDTTDALALATEEPAKPLSRVTIGGIFLGIAACSAAVLWFAYFEPATDLSLVPAPPTVVVVPNPTALPYSTEMVATLEPFLIEDRREGQVNFLETQFALVAEDKDTYRDIIDKNLILRDAIYYYLNNQDASFLFEPKNIKILKNVLEGIVNGHLGQGKLKELLIVQYLIR